MTKIKNIKVFGKYKAKAYKFTFNDKVFLLDCGSTHITPNDVEDVDYLFISHEHKDHWGPLINYQLSVHLDKCKIFCTKTTKDILINLLHQRIYEDLQLPDGNIIKKKYYKPEAEEYMLNFFNNFNECFFNEEYTLDNNIKFKLFRSGHTFGSSMVYLYDDVETLLYTGDFDYVKSNNSRQYQVPYDLKVDTLIVDGTRLLKEQFKGISVEEIRSYLNRRGEGKYLVKVEKGVIYALNLIKKMDDIVIFYDPKFGEILQILANNGYDPYVPYKVMLKPLQEDFDYHKEFPNKKLVFLIKAPDFDEMDKNSKPSYKKGDPLPLDNKLGLHITKEDLIDFVETHLIEYPKNFLIGHYEYSKKDLLDVGKLKKARILFLGDNRL